MVRDGDMVKQGDIIGLSGGIPVPAERGFIPRAALHFEVLKTASSGPPDYWLFEPGILDLSALRD